MTPGSKKLAFNIKNHVIFGFLLIHTQRTQNFINIFSYLKKGKDRRGQIAKITKNVSVKIKLLPLGFKKTEFRGHSRSPDVKNLRYRSHLKI